VPNGLWPATYDGAYLYGDHICGQIFTLKQSGGSYTSAVFATQVGGITAMAFGPPAGAQALYYTTFSNGGQVRKITYTGGANRSPSASISADPSFGAAPLQVMFNSAGSADPDGDTLSYAWNFGDGATQSGGATAAHTYAATGTYTATLTVSDGRGGSDSAQARVDVGNTPPVPSIDAPAATSGSASNSRSRFRAAPPTRRTARCRARP
jgi:PKD repeat protein